MTRSRVFYEDEEIMGTPPAYFFSGELFLTGICRRSQIFLLANLWLVAENVCHGDVVPEAVQNAPAHHERLLLQQSPRRYKTAGYRDDETAILPGPVW